MNYAAATLSKFLQQREAEGSIRSLRDTSQLVDFCSNDYLGFARSVDLQQRIKERLETIHQVGATGSRLISGNYPLYEATERLLAGFHQADAALIFNSGYDANIGFFSAVPQRSDLVLYDELIHASVRDGLKMSKAASLSFRHNDLHDLKTHLEAAKGNNVFVAVESVYSMDGDLAPLQKMSELCATFNAQLVVDEAHATGVFGTRGEGRAGELGLEQHCFARIHTFGKALGCHGGVVLGSDVLRRFLINYARSFIFTTALPLHSMVSIQCAYEMLPEAVAERKLLNDHITYFRNNIRIPEDTQLIAGEGPIQSIVAPGNLRSRNISDALEKAGYYAKAILYPTVPKGKERLRICLHSFNTREEVSGLVESLNKALSA